MHVDKQRRARRCPRTRPRRCPPAHLHASPYLPGSPQIQVSAPGDGSSDVFCVGRIWRLRLVCPYRATPAFPLVETVFAQRTVRLWRMRRVLSAVVRGRCGGTGWRLSVMGAMGRVGVARQRSLRPRVVVVSVRLTRQEAEQIDRARGHLSRSEWVRWLLLRQRRP